MRLISQIYLLSSLAALLMAASTLVLAKKYGHVEQVPFTPGGWICMALFFAGVSADAYGVEKEVVRPLLYSGFAGLAFLFVRRRLRRKSEEQAPRT